MLKKPVPMHATEILWYQKESYVLFGASFRYKFCECVSPV